MLTQQEVFEKSARHLMTQRKKSKGDNGAGGMMCVYRNPEGLGCAVAPLIADVYRPEMENKTASALFHSFSAEMKEAGLGIWEHGHLLGKLQHIHDNYEPSVWLIQLMRTANAHPDLDGSFLDAYEPIE